MTLIDLGLAIFIGTHLFTAYARGLRRGLVGKLGEMGYKGAYSLVSLGGFILIIVGWKQATPQPVYTLPEWGTPLSYALMAASLILFAAAYMPTGRIKSLAGHPMALGTILFSAAHLLANGDSRSITVFGAFLVYSVLDRISYPLRGDHGPKGTSVLGDVGSVLGGLGSALVIVFYLHPYLAGVALEPLGVLGG